MPSSSSPCPRFARLDDRLRTQLTRRTLLTGGLALCGLSSARLFGHSTLAAPPRSLRFDPFTLGVASGDPSRRRVVLWTRLAPDPLQRRRHAASRCRRRLGGGRGRADAEGRPAAAWRRRGPEWAHSVHVEVSGLEPDRWYWYRFRVGDAASRIGRTRTLPPARCAGRSAAVRVCLVPALRDRVLHGTTGIMCRRGRSTSSFTWATTSTRAAAATTQVRDITPGRRS